MLALFGMSAVVFLVVGPALASSIANAPTPISARAVGGANNVIGTGSLFTGPGIIATWGDGQASYRTDSPPTGAAAHSVADIVIAGNDSYTLPVVKGTVTFYSNFSQTLTWDYAYKCFSPPGLGAYWWLNLTFTIQVYTPSGTLLTQNSLPFVNAGAYTTCGTASWVTKNGVSTNVPPTVSVPVSATTTVAGTYTVVSTITVETSVATTDVTGYYNDVGAVSCVDWGYNPTLPTISSSPLPYGVCPGNAAGIDTHHFVALNSVTVT